VAWRPPLSQDPSDPKRTVTRTFVESLALSIIGERTRPESMAELVDAIVDAWDGKRPVSAQPLYEQLERLHGADVAAAAALDFKAIAEKHAILVELPKHLKTLRLQERQELSARYHPREQSPVAAPDAAPQAPASNAGSAPVLEAVSGKRARPVGVPAALALALLVGYLGVRVFWLGDAPEEAPGWTDAALPADPAGLPCASVRAAGPILECTLPRAAFEGMPRADFAARAAVTKRAVVTTGKSRLRVKTDDGVVRGAF
jgi:hypothetical protein